MENPAGVSCPECGEPNSRYASRCARCNASLGQRLEPGRGGIARLVGTGLFVLVLVSFLMPWVSVECAGVTVQATGVDLVAGKEEQDAEGRSQRAGSEPLAVIALVLGIVGVGFFFAKGKVRNIGRVLTGLLGAIILIALKFKVEGDIQAGVIQAGVPASAVSVSWEIGFWLALLFFRLAAGADALQLPRLRRVVSQFISAEPVDLGGRSPPLHLREEPRGGINRAVAPPIAPPAPPATPAGQPMVPCPRCGAQNPRFAPSCFNCGTVFGQQGLTMERRVQERPPSGGEFTDRLDAPEKKPTTIACPSCHEANDADEIYCQRCSLQLCGDRVCLSCGRHVPVKAGYCIYCKGRL